MIPIVLLVVFSLWFLVGIGLVAEGHADSRKERVDPNAHKYLFRGTWTALLQSSKALGTGDRLGADTYLSQAKQAYVGEKASNEQAVIDQPETLRDVYKTQVDSAERTIQQQIDELDARLHPGKTRPTADQ